MLRTFFQPLGLAAGLLLAACHSDKKPVASTDDHSSPPDTATAAGNPLGASYRIYRGAVPGAADSLTLHLLVTPQFQNAETASISATYYGADGQPFALYGELRAHGDSLRLTEGSYEKLDHNQQGAEWRLRWQGPRLVGTRAGQPLQLYERQPAGSLAFAVQCFADSVAAFPDLANTPYGKVSLQALLPTPASPATAALRAQLLRDLRADNRPAWPLAQLWQQQRRQFTQLYREDVAGSRPSPADSVDGPFGFGLHYEQAGSMYVYWNEADLLSIGYYTYSYTGGAHGSFRTWVRSYDPRTGRPIGRADVFRPGAAGPLAAAINRAARRTLRLAPSEQLREILLVDEIPVTDNFYLTDSGVMFVYGPYEIASYAMGEVPIFVPFTEIKSLLRPMSEPLS